MSATSSATARARTASHPPNNWVSMFGGPAWTRVVEPDGNPGQWYLHLFDAEQPDLNWDNPEVFDDLEKTLRFWLERGVDGFRIDVAHGMAKPPGLPDMRSRSRPRCCCRHGRRPAVQPRRRARRSTASIRTVLDDYPGRRRDRRGLGVRQRAVRPSICGPTNCISASISGWCEPSSTRPTSAAPSRTPAAAALAGRHADLDAGQSRRRSRGHPLRRRRRRPGRARAMALVMLALPGAVFIYNGEELGLPNVELPDEALQDPMWERSGHTKRGRDGCRVPMPWAGDAPPFGFSTNRRHLAADAGRVGGADGARRQLADPASTLSFFRRAIELRGSRAEFGGADVEWLTPPRDTLVFRLQRRPGVRAECRAARADDLPAGEMHAWPARRWSDGRACRPKPPAWLRLATRCSCSCERGQRSTSAGSPRRRYTEPNRASIRSQAGSTRTRTISSAATVSGSSLAGLDCGRKPIAVKANTQRIGMPDADVAELTATTSWSSSDAGGPCALRVFLGERDATLGQVQHHPGGHVVEVDEAGVRRQNAAPRRIHRETRVDIARRGPSPSARAVSASAPARQVGGPDPARRRPGWPAHRNPLPPRRRSGRRNAAAAGSTAASSSRNARSVNVARSSRWVASSQPDARVRVPVIEDPAMQILPLVRAKADQPLLVDMHGGQLRLGDHRRLGCPGRRATGRTS